MDTFQTRWVTARQLEDAGNFELAAKAYEQILNIEPERLYARVRLCNLLQMMGQYRNAHAQVTRAIDSVSDGQRPADLHHVTRQLLAFGEHEQIKRMVLSADWDRVEIVGTSPVLIQHLWLSGEVEQALFLCERVLSLAPDHPALNYSHGILLNFVGRQEDAAQAFERCLRADPLHAGAHWSLAYLGNPVRPEDRIPAIEAALEERLANHDTESAIYLHHALFKTLDDAGRPRDAWTHLTAGADLKRETLTYSSAQDASALHAFLHRFEPAPAKDPASLNPVKHIFVVGMPRTGTTMLDRIFGNHPLVTSVGELQEFRSALSWELDQFVSSELDAGILERVKKLSLSAVGQRYRESIAWRAQPGRTVMVDKNPENFFLSEFIAEALDDAKIICLRRKPMDACFSNLKELFANDSYGYSYRIEELAEHYHVFEQLALHWQASMPERFVIVDYEDLVTHPAEASEKLFRFCGLSFESEYVDITRNRSSVATASAAQVRNAISTNRIDAWKEYAEQLSPLRAHLESLGYVID